MKKLERVVEIRETIKLFFKNLLTAKGFYDIIIAETR